MIAKLATQYAVPVLLYAAVAGCSKEVKIHFYDKEAMTALQQYQPSFELNEAGRVVKLKLEGLQVTDAVFDHVKNLTELKSLSLYGSSITDSGLSQLTGLGRLESLGLGQTAISNRGLAHLGQIPNLRWLWLSNNAKLSKLDIANLKKARAQLTVYE